VPYKKTCVKCCVQDGSETTDCCPMSCCTEGACSSACASSVSSSITGSQRAVGRPDNTWLLSPLESPHDEPERCPAECRP